MSKAKFSPTYENMDLWWVYVVHTDGKTEYAQVNQFLDWTPKNPNDFNQSKKYIIRTNKWRQDQKYDRCKVYILKMGEIRSKLEDEVSKKRPHIPRLEVESSDFMSELSDMEGVPSGANTKNCGTKRRATPTEVAAKKSRAEQVNMEKFAAEMSCLYPDNFSDLDSNFSSSKFQTPKSKTPAPQKPKLASKNTALDKAAIPSTSSSVTNNLFSSVKSLLAQSTPKPTTPKPPTPKPTTPKSTNPKIPTPKATTPKTSTPITTTPKRTTMTSKKVTPICRSTEIEAQSSGISLQSGRSLYSNIVRHVDRNFPPSPLGPPEAKKTFTEDDMRRKDEEMERLKEQLKAAQAQIDIKDKAILGELRSLSNRVAKIEEAVSSKCYSDYLNSVQLWLNKYCDYSHGESNSSHSV